MLLAIDSSFGDFPPPWVSTQVSLCGSGSTPASQCAKGNGADPQPQHTAAFGAAHCRCPTTRASPQPASWLPEHGSSHCSEELSDRVLFSQPCQEPNLNNNEARLQAAGLIPVHADFFIKLCLARAFPAAEPLSASIAPSRYAGGTLQTSLSQQSPQCHGAVLQGLVPAWGKALNPDGNPETFLSWPWPIPYFPPEITAAER